MINSNQTDAYHLIVKSKLCVLVTLCMLLTGCNNTDIGVIGGADGPTAILINEKGENTMYKQITPDEAKKIMDNEEGYIILDVREQEEFDTGHIPGAILIPYTEIEQNAEKLLPDKNKQILVYCRSGRRSKIAAENLAMLGYTDIKEFGGINDWNYEIEK